MAVAPLPPAALRCRHCRVRRPWHGYRGLCKVCYADPAIREKYPKQKTGVRADGLLEGAFVTGEPQPAPPGELGPTDLPPWDPRKAVLMEQRVAAGYAARHPGDVGDRGA